MVLSRWILPKARSAAASAFSSECGRLCRAVQPQSAAVAQLQCCGVSYTVCRAVNLKIQRYVDLFGFLKPWVVLRKKASVIHVACEELCLLRGKQSKKAAFPVILVSIPFGFV